MFKFSKQLRKEAISYFSSISNKEISHEEADEYLRSLASLCSALIDIKIKG